MKSFVGRVFCIGLMVMFAYSGTACADDDVIKETGLKYIGKNGVKKIVIPSFQVIFRTREGGTAKSKKGFFSSVGNQAEASAAMVVNLTEIDKALFQKIADAAYNEFGKSLAAAGIEVLPLATVTGNPAYQKISAAENADKDGFVIVAPTGLKIYDPNGKMDPNGGFMLGINNMNFAGEGNLVKALSDKPEDTAVARVVVVVSFGSFSKEASNFLTANATGTASASIAFKSVLNLNPGFPSGMTNYMTSVTLLSKYNGILLQDTSSVWLKKELFSNAQVATLKESTTTGEKVGMAAVNVLGALGGKSGSFSRYDATLAKADYEKAAVGTISKFGSLIADKIKSGD